ncbi:alkaline exonuclease [Murine herpesvirus strain 4556]|uniref:37 protein n=2 Tax=Orthoherpesviridae TaxID=3044472 RepID=O41954_MHV68|nr:alkaline exonuclease [Murid gammaherpesvirus 4]AXP99108.1 alkaline exonuclease [synthetic construct]QJQ80225.1 alkaline exonuclease [Murine herpesvirus]UNZ86666.1 alkaline exonuclease [Murine herpesvirus strain 72]UNZ86743.1 alkaline exonuclease [Murine herpesvirus strain 4556]AAB66406.1 alkaline exonuclease [Murid gammaherpesvirus 4]
MEGSIILDFFEKDDLLEVLGNMARENQLESLATLNFSAFIRSPQVQELLATSKTSVRISDMRLTYYYFLFLRLNEYIGNTAIMGVFKDMMHLTDNSEVSAVYAACRDVTPDIKYAVCQRIEALTRGQQDNELWDILRDGMISSSKFQWAVKQHSINKKLFNPQPIKVNHYFAGPLAFGIRCEQTVKKILSELIHPNLPRFHDCGFLPSAIDGIFGVSLDTAFNVFTDSSGLVHFEPDSIVYEIKSRYKYQFSKSEFDGLAKKYLDLYKNPCEATFIKFINCISRPAVEYVPHGKLPSESDYLITHSMNWKTSNKRKRKITDSHICLKKCLLHNMYQQSTVYILSDPSETSGKITIKASFPIDVFVNPAHNYFYQVALQNMVVQDYIEFGQGVYKRLGHQKNFIASGFFRKRHFSDPAVCSIGNCGKLDTTDEIPVALIITPVRIPSTVLHEYLKKAIDFWNQCAEANFDHIPWGQLSDVARKPITP